MPWLDATNKKLAQLKKGGVDTESISYGFRYKY